MTASPIPDHLVPLGDESWALWRRNGLRSTGFPAAEVLPLGSPALAAAVDCVLDAESALETAQGKARAETGTVVEAALDALRREGAWGDTARRKRLLESKKAAARGSVSALAELGLAGAAEALAQARQTLLAARTELAPSFEQALAEQAAAIHAVACSPRFREAVLWQNRAAFHTGVETVASRPPAGATRDAQRRKHEEMIASYLQRYTLKNDTIGFFGPFVPFDFADHGAALSVRPGPGLIAESQVFFEGWCLDELTRPFARQELMRPWLPPRRNPLARLEGGVVHLPERAPSARSARHAAVFAACDGEKTAREIAAALLADPALGLGGEKEVYALLDQLLRQELIGWDFGLSWVPWSGELLAARMAAIGHPKLHAVGRQTLETLERARREVAAALGDPAALAHALERLDDTFRRFTGAPPTRRAGQVYGGRTLVYLSCRRDVEVVCGPELVRELAAPLGLVLDSARWLTHEIATATRKVFFDVYRELARRGGATVDGIVYLQMLEPALVGGSHLAQVGPRLHERWGELLGARSEQHRLDLRSADLRERARELFACPGAGWALARCHSPDVMIAAASAEAVRAGRYQLVLGEVHVGMNTLNTWGLFDLWPEREAVLRQLDSDLPQPRLALLAVKDEERITPRTLPAHYSPHELLVSTSLHAALRFPGRELAAAELVIEEEAGELIVRSRDGRHRLGGISALGRYLSKIATVEFGFLPSAGHWPRICLDRLVIHRESWQIPAVEMMVFAGEKDGAERFFAARRWARTLGLPRFVFIKSPLEVKPIYADLASPIYVDLLAKLVRRTAAEDTPQRQLVLKLSEMLPTPDQLWLADAEDRRYCSELRLVAIDRRPLAGA